MSLAAVPPLYAQGFSSRPVAAKSQARLLSSGGLQEGTYRAGLDIVLAPGVLTYWRDPGEAGVPPEFSFEGSQNVASAKASFPAPERIVEEGLTAYGYMNEVLFPIAVAPKDPALPAVLEVTLHYATCDTICVPAATQQSLRLSPSQPTGPDAAKISQWEARAPTPLPPTLAPRISALSGGAKASWRATFPRSMAKTDLFVEGPDGWYFDSKPLGAGAFNISLAQAPDGAKAGAVPATLTYVDGDRAYQTQVNLKTQVNLDAGGR